MGVIPTGAVHEVGLEDMFFSTTDAKGVIQQANEVFVRLARRSRPELLGNPHNVIRHPVMPGGIYRLIWNMLKAGQPTCGYLVNLGGDGSAYWTMATMLPAGDGFLSVRTRPCSSELVDLAARIYQEIRPAEEAARAAGSTAAQAAEIGEELVVKALSSHGFASYQAFIQAALPAEVEARIAISGGLPERPDSTGALHLMLDAVSQIETQVRTLTLELADFSGQAKDLQEWVTGTQGAVDSLDTALQSARTIIDPIAEEVPLLAGAGEPLHERCHHFAVTLEQVAQAVTTLANDRAQLRFSVAMAQMQAEMMGRFVIALIDRIENPESSDEAIRSLAQALQHGLTDVHVDLEGNLASSATVRTQIQSSGMALRITRMSMGKWRSLIDRYELEDRLSEQIPALDRSLTAMADGIAGLTTAVDRFGESTVAFDMTPIEEQLRRALTMLRLTA